MRERAARRLLGVLGGVVLAASACGTTALTSSNGAATEPNAPRWQSEGEVDTVGSRESRCRKKRVLKMRRTGKR
jgi:hypothetical protein